MRGQGRIFRNESGEAVRVIGIGFDVTSRRQEERATRQLSVIALASSDAVVSVDAAGNVTEWNPGAEQLFGYSADEMLGQSIGRIAPPDRVAEIPQILSRLASGQHVDNFETERIRKDGTRVFISISSGPLFDESGNWVGAATITQDVTARRQEQNRQRLLADAGSVLSASLDVDNMLAEVAGLLVPGFADSCEIYLQGQDGVVECVAETPGRASKILDQRNRASAVRPQAPPPYITEVLSTGEPVEVDRTGTGSLTGVTVISARAFMFDSALVVPLFARGAVIGAIALYAKTTQRRFEAGDAETTIALARRLALAIDNARLFNRVQEAERQLRLLADNLPAMVSYVGTDYRYHFVNQRYGDYLGTPTEELLGRSLQDILQPESFALVEANLRRAFGGEAVRYAMDVSYPEAGERHVEIDYVPDIGPTGETRGAVALIVDVSERARVQRRASRLYELTVALASATTESEVADCIVSFGVDTVDGIAGVVFGFDANKSEFTVTARRVLAETFSVGDTVSIPEESALGEAAQIRHLVVRGPDAEQASSVPGKVAAEQLFADQMHVTVPCVVEGELIGLFAVAFSSPRLFDRADYDFLSTLGFLCAQSIDRARNYDAERRARSVAEIDRVRVAFLAEASRVLVGSLDSGVELKRVMAVAAGSLCDWCTVHLVGEDGSLSRLGVVHRDPTKSAFAQELEQHYSTLPPTCWRSVQEALQSGKSWFDPVVQKERLAAETFDGGHRVLLEELGFASEIVVPMVAGGRMVGSMTFVRGPESKPFETGDLHLAEELGTRIALALENARLFADAQGSEERYRTLFEEASEAILIVDLAGVIRSGNDAAATLLGIERKRLVGRLASDIFGVERDQEVSGIVLEFLQSSWQGELEAMREDGVAVPVELHTTLVELPSGPAFLVSLRDVSERRALERLQGDFLAMVTHDLRSPLAAIRVQSQLMRRKGQFSEAGVEAIIGQTDRMARLINALADVVRMDSGQLDLNRSEVDLVALVQEVVSQEQANAPEHTVVVRAPLAVVGFWDSDRLAQVVSNLVGNAVKYSPVVSTVFVEVSASNGEGSVSVIDSGAGIAAEHVSKLFERFYRADVTGAGGLGLGLYIARMLTDAHGGRIVVDSAPGRGSTFTVILPIVSPG